MNWYNAYTCTLKELLLEGNYCNEKMGISTKAIVSNVKFCLTCLCIVKHPMEVKTSMLDDELSSVVGVCQLIGLMVHIE